MFVKKSFVNRFHDLNDNFKKVKDTVAHQVHEAIERCGGEEALSFQFPTSMDFWLFIVFVMSSRFTKPSKHKRVGKARSDKAALRIKKSKRK